MKPYSFLTKLLLPCAAIGLSGCASSMLHPRMDVSMSVNAYAPERQAKSYVVVCTNPAVARWFVANPAAVADLGQVLAAKGYEEAAYADAATHILEIDLGFGPRQRMFTGAENTDSVRFQNVAAMIGSGRYTQVLTERDGDSGSILMGPDGQIIPTGQWKKMIEHEKENMAMTDRSSDFFMLRAWDVGDEISPRMVAWEVLVVRPTDTRPPSPADVGVMVRGAAERLENAVGL